MFSTTRCEKHVFWHYSDVIIGPTASQITSLTIVYSTVYSSADKKKYQISASLVFVWGIHQWPVNSPQKWPVKRKLFPFDDVIMECHVLNLLPVEIDCRVPKVKHTDDLMIPFGELLGHNKQAKANKNSCYHGHYLQILVVETNCGYISWSFSEISSQRFNWSTDQHWFR